MARLGSAAVSNAFGPSSNVNVCVMMWVTFDFLFAKLLMTSKMSSLVYPRAPMILHSVLITCMKLMGTSFFVKPHTITWPLVWHNSENRLGYSPPPHSRWPHQYR